ncbi:hypothetical protein G6704_08990 [Polynucleobacter paneuropaeus]|nr:hypothetical protein G6704_08990 [Polynucleobacter paneuropaeus]
MNPMDRSNQIIDNLIKFFRRAISVEFFVQSEQRLEQAASYAAPVAAIVGLLMGLTAAIKTDSFIAFLAGIGWVIAIAVGYYIGSKFLVSCKTVVHNNPTRISSKEYIDVIGLIGVLGIIFVALGGIVLAIKMSSPDILKWTALIVVALVFSVCFSLHPSLVSTNIDKNTSAGEDAIAILAFGYKISVRMAGVIFGAATIFGTVNLIFGLFRLIKGSGFEIYAGGLESIEGVAQVLGGLAYPFLAYVFFVIFYLAIDLMKAILSISSGGVSHGGSTGTNNSAPPQQPFQTGTSGSSQGDPTVFKSPISIDPQVAKKIVIGLVAASVIGGIGYGGWQYKLELDRKAEITQQEEIAKAEEAKRQEEAKQEALRQEELAKAEEVQRQEFAKQEAARQEEERKRALANPQVLPSQCTNHFNANYNKPGYGNNKAYAVAYDGTNSYCTMSYNSPTPQQATQNALQNCEQNKYKNNVRTACYVYKLN